MTCPTLCPWSSPRAASIACALLVTLALPATAQTPPWSAFLLDPARESALARSAAPAALAEHAGLWLLRPSGVYEQVAPSENGFNCLVERSFTAPSTNPAEFYSPAVTAPICFNADASATVMQRDLFLAPLVARGVPNAEIRTREADAYASGRLKYPEKTIFAYMFSSANVLWLGTEAGPWHPHLMVWAPGFVPADLVPAGVGTFGVHSGHPIMDPRYGPRQILIAIPVATAIDPRVR